MDKMPKPGDRVRVPFGLAGKTVEGRVLRTRNFRKVRTVQVELDIDGVDPPIFATYDLADVEVPSAA